MDVHSSTYPASGCYRLFMFCTDMTYVIRFELCESSTWTMALKVVSASVTKSPTHFIILTHETQACYVRIPSRVSPSPFAINHLEE